MVMAHEVNGVIPLRPVPQQRIVEKLDEYMSRRDYAGAERHLKFWLEEALAAGDERGELMLRNELVGHFRKTGNEEQALLHAEEALRLVEELGFARTISAGTTYTNVATALNAFGHDERSLELFDKAVELYEGSPSTDPRLLGGLYNNRALVCVTLRKFDEANQLYEKALATMAKVENGELEQAITYLNMADAAVAQCEAQSLETAESQSGLEQCEQAVGSMLATALELLDTPSIPRDGYYAFVCEKCAPTFAHYGYFLADEDLRARAKAIYERT